MFENLPYTKVIFFYCSNVIGHFPFRFMYVILVQNIVVLGVLNFTHLFTFKPYALLLYVIQFESTLIYCFVLSIITSIKKYCFHPKKVPNLSNIVKR